MEKKNVNKNKSKHGKKNWRKNIDVTDIEIKQEKKNKEILERKTMSSLKDNDLFSVDVSKAGKKLIGIKTKREGKKVRNMSKYEERKIKRMIENHSEKGKNMEKENSKRLIDLWEDENPLTKIKKTKSIKISYPNVPIAHPGQSYNPDKGDLNKLLTKIVDLNKDTILKEEISKEKKKKEKKTREIEQNEENYFEEDEPIKHPVANNEPVTDDNRLSKKEKKRKEIKKKNKLKDKQDMNRKKTRLNLHNSASLKQTLKEQKKQEEILEQKEKEKKKLEHKRQSQLKYGIVEDKDLLEEFRVNREQVPLRKLKSDTNILVNKWDNIMKRGVIGEFTRLTKRKANRKLNKKQYIDVKHREDIYLDPKTNLEIYE